MRDEFDAFPPFVTAPTYTTADKELAWLNRAQCLGLGRVDTKAMRIESDVYIVERGRPQTCRVSARLRIATEPDALAPTIALLDNGALT